MKADVLKVRPVQLKDGSQKFVHETAVFLPDADGAEPKYPTIIEIWENTPYAVGECFASLRHYVRDGRIGVAVNLAV